MNGMDEVEVAQAQIADVPATFDGSVVLLDVREDDEWQRGHAPGAQHIPMGQVPSRIGEIRRRRDAVRGVPGRRPVAAGGAVSGPQRLHPGERVGRHVGLGRCRPSCRHRRRRYGRHLTGRR